jgi:hypothetical protein
MSETEVSFSRRLYRDVSMNCSTVGPVRLDYEVVTGIQTDEVSTPTFEHFQVPGKYTSAENINPLTVRMGKRMATKIMQFCQAAYVDGDPNFNCFAFVGHAFAWQDGIAKPPRHQYSGRRMAPDEDTELNFPYVVHAPDTSVDGDPVVHGMLGADRPGYSLNVIGPLRPLAFVRNSDVMRMYGARGLVSVTSRKLLEA